MVKASTPSFRSKVKHSSTHSLWLFQWFVPINFIDIKFVDLKVSSVFTGFVLKQSSNYFFSKPSWWGWHLILVCGLEGSMQGSMLKVISVNRDGCFLKLYLNGKQLIPWLFNSSIAVTPVDFNHCNANVVVAALRDINPRNLVTQFKLPWKYSGGLAGLWNCCTFYLFKQKSIWK